MRILLSYPSQPHHRPGEFTPQCINKTRRQSRKRKKKTKRRCIYIIWRRRYHMHLHTHTIFDSYIIGDIRHQVHLHLQNGVLESDDDHTMQCYRLYREIDLHYPGLKNLTTEGIVSAYVYYLREWGESNVLHCAASLAQENNVHFIDSDTESVTELNNNTSEPSPRMQEINTCNTEGTQSTNSVMKQGLLDLYFYPLSREPSTNYTCGICHRHIKKIELQSMIDCCGHRFCYDCITEWRKVGTTCPFCRATIKRVDKLYWVIDKNTHARRSKRKMSTQAKRL